MYMSEQKPNDGTKQHIKALVYIGPNSSGDVAHVKTQAEKGQYEGYSWDLFQKCMQRPDIDKKYTFDITYSPFGWTNHKQTMKDIASGKYDIALAGFFPTQERELVVNFTTSIKIDANAIFHIKKQRVMDELVTLFMNVSGYILGSIVVGIVIGLVLYYGNPGRIKYVRGVGKKNFLIRSIITGIAAMFGEMGYLSENASHTYVGAFIVIITMLVAYMGVMFIQAEMTSTLVQKRINQGMSKYTLTAGVILGHEGNAAPKKIEEDGGRIHYVKGKTNDELVKFYLANTDKYNGVALSYCTGYPYLTIYPHLMVSIGFGNEPTSWPVNPDKIDFLEDMNNAILSLRKSREMNILCVKYFGSLKHIPACSLR